MIPRVRHVLLRLLKLELLQVYDARVSLFQSSQELLFLHTLHIQLVLGRVELVLRLHELLLDLV